MLTWTARGVLNVKNLATGQENALPPGIAHEVLIAEPHSPQDTRTAPKDTVTEPHSTRCKAVMFLMRRLLISLRYIEIANCLSLSYVLVRRVSTSREIFVETSKFGSILEPLVLFLTL